MNGWCQRRKLFESELPENCSKNCPENAHLFDRCGWPRCTHRSSSGHVQNWTNRSAGCYLGHKPERLDHEMSSHPELARPLCEKMKKGFSSFRGKGFQNEIFTSSKIRWSGNFSKQNLLSCRSKREHFDWAVQTKTPIGAFGFLAKSDGIQLDEVHQSQNETKSPRLSKWDSKGDSPSGTRV